MTSPLLANALLLILSNCRDIAPKKLHISTRNASPTRFGNILTSRLRIEAAPHQRCTMNLTGRGHCSLLTM